MLTSFARSHAIKAWILRANLGIVLSITCAAISIVFIEEGHYHLAAITAGANLIATRSIIRSKKARVEADEKTCRDLRI